MLVWSASFKKMAVGLKLSISSLDGFDYVTEIICANGEIYNDDGMGDDYFELSEEFYCFREYKEPTSEEDEVKDKVSGVTKIHCIVDEQCR
ncbi:hypothetical protein T4583L_241 [Escherichia phage T4]|nr:hypothetical protein T4583L_241 [Escherichia phage T4]